MTTNLFNASPYLRSTREFSPTINSLITDLDKAYVDTAICVNSRVIGTYTTTKAAITGEQWFVTTSEKKQTLRQVYAITGAGSYPHGLDLARIGSFTRIYGVGFDGTNYYPLPYVNATAANNQIEISVTPTNIVVTAGAGTPPAITSGVVVLEWF